MSPIDGFAFNDFCQRCQKIMQHKIVSESTALLGVCVSCGESRPLTEPNQIYYSSTDLWVTRFKIGNLQSVVTGRLLDATKDRMGNA